MTKLLKAIDRDEIDDFVRAGWQVVPAAETYNGDRWKILVWRWADERFDTSDTGGDE